MSANLADIMVAISLSDRLSKPISGICDNLAALGRQFKEITRSAASFGDKMSAIGDSMSRTGKSMMGEAMSGAMGLKLFADKLMSPVMESANFEQAIGRVKALVEDETGELHAMLEEQARQLGRDTQFTNLQAAMSQENLVRANFSAYETLSAMPHLLNMAAVEGMDLAEASSIMAGAMRGFGIDASEAQRVVDVLAQGSAIAKTNIQGLGNAMAYAAPTARTLGIPIEEATAMIGIMADNSIDASKAGTALSMGLTQLANKQGKLDKLGIHIADSSGNLLPILDVLQQMEAYTSKMDSLKRQAFFADIFGVEAARGMSTVIRGTKEGADGLSEFTKKVGKLKGASDAFDGMGFAAAKAGEVNNTLIGSLTRLSSAWSDLKTNIGDAFKNDLRGLAEALTELISKISQFVRENPRLVAAIQKVVVAFMSYKAISIGGKFLFGASLDSLGKFVKTFGALQKAGVGLRKAFSGAGGEAGGVFKAFKLLTSPVFWLVAGFVALAAIIYLMYKHWDHLGEYVKEHKALFITLGTIVGVGVVAAFAGAASSVWAFTVALLANPITWIILAVGLLIAALLDLYYNWDDICYEWRVNWEQFKHVCGLAIDEIVAFLEPLIGKLREVVGWFSDLLGLSATSQSELRKNIYGVFDAAPNEFGSWNAKRDTQIIEFSEDGNGSSGTFATGGFFNRPTLGIFGEAGPEWIIPADGSPLTLGLLADAAAANGISLGGGGVISGGGGVTISGPVYISVPETDNAEAFVEKLAQGLRRYASSQGAVAY